MMDARCRKRRRFRPLALRQAQGERDLGAVIVELLERAMCGSHSKGYGFGSE